MRSLFGLILLIVVPFSSIAQPRLFFHAMVMMPVSGTRTVEVHRGDDQNLSFTDNVKVTIKDTVALASGENMDSLRNSEIVLIGGGPTYKCPGNCSFEFDTQNQMLRNVKITGGGLFNYFAMSFDSIPVTALSDSTWIDSNSNTSCVYSCHYEYYYLLPDLANGTLVANGEGKSTFIAASVESTIPISEPPVNIRIVAQSAGAVEIEVVSSISVPFIEIFDGVGRKVFSERLHEHLIHISNLSPGCYFARLGNEVTKFVVMP